jgi:hypothetical protein
MSVKGIEKKTIKSSANDFQILLGLKKPDKVRKVRAKETKPRRQEEAEFRKVVVRYLKSKGYYFKRIENGVTGKYLGNGVPDFLFFTRTKFYFLELKSQTGGLRDEQEEFKQACERTGVGYILARSIKDIEDEITRLPLL